MEENNNEILLEQTIEESELFDLPEQRRKIYTDQGDPEIDSLYRKWKDGDLDLQPDFQRGFVWDIVKASRLIESILLDIPLPVIYLSQDKDGREYVIDGQQRLTSFFSYIDGKLPDPQLPYGKDFRLKGLNVFNELIGKYFKDLPREIQRKIRYYKIRTITLRKESEPDLKFEVYSRLNTGSVALNDQELRNCIYRGSYNDLLIELSKDKTFRELLGLKKPEKRMRDVELVLRFASFYHSTYQNYKPTIKKFLNNDMKNYRNISENNANELKSAFKTTTTIIKSLLGEHAFKRYYSGDQTHPNGHWEPKKFNASLYDILMDSFARQDKNSVIRNLDSIKEAFLDLMTSDQKFIDSIELDTSSSQAIKERFTKWNNTLELILGVSYKEPRCFSYYLKEQLFKSSPTCTICNQKIIDINDAAVDHIEQYWAGGRTIPENARLTHRYCNNARSRNEKQLIPGNIPIAPIITRTRSSRGRIIKIENDLLECNNAVSVLINTANWLITKGKLSAFKCPIKLQDRGSSYIINTHPYHEDGRSFTAKKQLKSNLFLEGNFSTKDCIRWSNELLIRFGIKDFDFDENE